MTIAATGSIVSAEDRYFAHPSHPEHTPAEAVVYRFWRHHVNIPGPQRLQMKGEWPTATVQGVTGVAYVNHGNWMVDCPFPGCNSAQFASRTDRRFYCVECGRGWVAVTWPSELDVAAIEAALSIRPESTTRNWFPGESVADLQAESAAHGVA